MWSTNSAAQARMIQRRIHSSERNDFEASLKNCEDWRACECSVVTCWCWVIPPVRPLGQLFHKWLKNNKSNHMAVVMKNTNTGLTTWWNKYHSYFVIVGYSMVYWRIQGVELPCVFIRTLRLSVTPLNINIVCNWTGIFFRSVIILCK